MRYLLTGSVTLFFVTPNCAEDKALTQLGIQRTEQLSAQYAIPDDGHTEVGKYDSTNNSTQLGI